MRPENLAVARCCEGLPRQAGRSPRDRLSVAFSQPEQGNRSPQSLGGENQELEVALVAGQGGRWSPCRSVIRTVHFRSLVHLVEFGLLRCPRTPSLQSRLFGLHILILLLENGK